MRDIRVFLGDGSYTETPSTLSESLYSNPGYTVLE